jgi:superkiller protein 3
MAKQLLKNARDAINNKNFEEAKDHCSSALELDPENYNALVFMGLSLQNLNDYNASETSYRKAITANSTSPLAYQVAHLLSEKSDADRNQV